MTSTHKHAQTVTIIVPQAMSQTHLAIHNARLTPSEHQSILHILSNTLKGKVEAPSVTGDAFFTNWSYENMYETYGKAWKGLTRNKHQKLSSLFETNHKYLNAKNGFTKSYRPHPFITDDYDNSLFELGEVKIAGIKPHKPNSKLGRYSRLMESISFGDQLQTILGLYSGTTDNPVMKSLYQQCDLANRSITYVNGAGNLSSSLTNLPLAISACMTIAGERVRVFTTHKNAEISVADLSNSLKYQAIILDGHLIVPESSVQALSDGGVLTILVEVESLKKLPKKAEEVVSITIVDEEDEKEINPVLEKALERIERGEKSLDEMTGQELIDLMFSDEIKEAPEVVEPKEKEEHKNPITATNDYINEDGEAVEYESNSIEERKLFEPCKKIEIYFKSSENKTPWTYTPTIDDDMVKILEEVEASNNNLKKNVTPKPKRKSVQSEVKRYQPPIKPISTTNDFINESYEEEVDLVGMFN